MNLEYLILFFLFDLNRLSICEKDDRNKFRISQIGFSVCQNIINIW